MSRLTLRRLIRLAGSGLGLGGVAWLLSFTARPLSASMLQPTRTPVYAPTATPPTQAGNGENVYFLYCMPCHGDQGQGLTDEFRARQYPPEDVDCWTSGCHGNRPYANGFTLPKTVPALIGSDTLGRFDTAADVYGFISSAMPFYAPGSLSTTQYLQLTAFLLERNGAAPAGVTLDPASLATFPLRAAPPTETSSASQPTETPSASPPPVTDIGAWVGLAGVVVVVIGVTVWLLVRRRPSL